MHHAVAHRDVGLDDLSHDHTGRMLLVADDGVALDDGCGQTQCVRSVWGYPRVSFAVRFDSLLRFLWSVLNEMVTCMFSLKAAVA